MSSGYVPCTTISHGTNLARSTTRHTGGAIRKLSGPSFHIDYMFAPERWLDAASISIGDFDHWVTEAGSDHAPIILDLDLDKISRGVTGRA